MQQRVQSSRSSGTMLRATALAFPLTLLSAAPLGAQDKSPEQCSADFHGVLRGQSQPAFAKLMDGTRTLIRTPDRSLPGRWLMTPSRLINPKAKAPTAKPDRVCVEEREQAGRKRCVRFADKPPSLVDLDFEQRLALAPEDAGLLRLVSDFVESRGIPPELGPNGRQSQVYQRLLNEMTGYVAQAPHPALCNGVPYMLDFYAKELAGLKARIKLVTAQPRRFDAVLGQRLTALRTALGIASTETPIPTSASSPPVSPAISMIAILEAIRPLVQTEAYDRVEAMSAPLSRLSAAKIALIEASRAPPPSIVPLPSQPTTVQLPPTPPASDTSPPVTTVPSVTAAPAAVALPVPAEVRAVAVQVLRLSEAAIYAQLYADRLTEINARIDDLLDGLRQGHAQKCLCGGE